MRRKDKSPSRAIHAYLVSANQTRLAWYAYNLALHSFLASGVYYSEPFMLLLPLDDHSHTMVRERGKLGEPPKRNRFLSALRGKKKGAEISITWPVSDLRKAATELSTVQQRWIYHHVHTGSCMVSCGPSTERRGGKTCNRALRRERETVHSHAAFGVKACLLCRKIAVK